MSAGAGDAGHPAASPAATGPAEEAARGWAAPMRTMHWTTVALLSAAYCAIWKAGAAATGADADWLAMLHRSFGVTALALTLVRLAWRQRTKVPPLPADLFLLQRLGARAGVVLLYGFLVSQPLLGLAGSMLHGDRITVFGIVLPNVLPVARPLAHLIFQVHGWVASLILAVVGVHMAAALHHHFVRRDKVLAGMLPGRMAPGPASSHGTARGSAVAQGS